MVTIRIKLVIQNLMELRMFQAGNQKTEFVYPNLKIIAITSCNNQLLVEMQMQACMYQNIGCFFVFFSILFLTKQVIQGGVKLHEP